MSDQSAERTTEFKEAYDKELKRLEAEAEKDIGKETAKTTSEEVKADEKEPLKAETSKVTQEFDQRIGSLEKALKDTQRWGHSNANEVARLKRELDTEKHKQNRPEILDKNPGLDEAIAYVARVEKPDPQQNWLGAVSTAITDVEELLSDPDFLREAQSRKAQLGSDWDNPLLAIRELSDLKINHLRNKAVSSAVDQARKDFQVKANKRSAMEVPGGSGGADPKVQVDEVKKVWDMPQEEFDRQRAKVMGHR